MVVHLKWSVRTWNQFLFHSMWKTHPFFHGSANFGIPGLGFAPTCGAGGGGWRTSGHVGRLRGTKPLVVCPRISHINVGPLFTIRTIAKLLSWFIATVSLGHWDLYGFMVDVRALRCLWLTKYTFTKDTAWPRLEHWFSCGSEVGLQWWMYALPRQTDATFCAMLWLHSTWINI